LAPNESLEQKVNYGGLLLQALLEFWPKPYNTEDESDPEQVPYIPVVVGIVTYPCVCGHCCGFGSGSGGSEIY
jgi:hypothetical protein